MTPHPIPMYRVEGIHLDRVESVQKDEIELCYHLIGDQGKHGKKDKKIVQEYIQINK
jgi:hypothetical protein